MRRSFCQPQFGLFGFVLKIAPQHIRSRRPKSRASLLRMLIIMLLAGSGDAFLVPAGTPIALPPAQVALAQEASFGPITFAERADDQFCPVDPSPNHAFLAGIDTLRGFFAYDGMSGDQRWEARWLFDGDEVKRDGGLWQGPARGPCAFVPLQAEELPASLRGSVLPNGTYALILSIDGDEVQRAVATVGVSDPGHIGIYLGQGEVHWITPAANQTGTATRDAAPGVRGLLWESPKYGWYAVPQGAFETIVPHTALIDNTMSPNTLPDPGSELPNLPPRGDITIVSAVSDQDVDGAVFASASYPERVGLVFARPDSQDDSITCLDEYRPVVENLAQTSTIDWAPDVDLEKGLALATDAVLRIGIDESMFVDESAWGLIRAEGSAEYSRLVSISCLSVDGVSGVKIELMPYSEDAYVGEYIPMIVGPMQSGYHNTARPRSSRRADRPPAGGRSRALWRVLHP